MGDLYLNGNGVKRDLARGAELILSAAKAHIPEAQNNMGWLLATGTGVEKNPNKAIGWYTKAAKTNYAPAQFNLAEALIGGLAGSRDIIEATHWYRKAATLGHVDSEYALGKLYAHNQPEESVKWMRRAANNGHARAQHQTATMYLKGIGVTINAKIAYDYFNLAANQNHPKSVLEIGLMLYEGYGIERNQEKGIEMVKRATNLGEKHASQKIRHLFLKKFDFLLNLNLASKGDTISMINLGWNYLKGKQLTKDKAESYAWFNLAAATSGNQKHIWARDYVAEQLSIKELVEAKKRAKQIKLIYGTEQSND